MFNDNSKLKLTIFHQLVKYIFKLEILLWKYDKSFTKIKRIYYRKASYMVIRKNLNECRSRYSISGKVLLHNPFVLFSCCAQCPVSSLLFHLTWSIGLSFSCLDCLEDLILLLHSHDKSSNCLWLIQRYTQ